MRCHIRKVLHRGGHPPHLDAVGVGATQFGEALGKGGCKLLGSVAVELGVAT